MMLDADLACDILTGRACRNDQTAPDTDPMKPSLAKYSEGKRLSQELPLRGWDMAKVSFNFAQRMHWHIYMSSSFESCDS
jgi:hypothetical protein